MTAEEPQELKEALDQLCEAIGEFQDVSDAWAKGTAETYLMEYAQKDVNACRARVESLFAKQREEIAELTVNFHTTTYANQELTRQLERQRETTLTAGEAGDLCEVIEQGPSLLWTDWPEIAVLYKKLRRWSSPLT